MSQSAASLLGEDASRRHSCLIYSTLDEYLDVTTTFIQQGIARNEQVDCICDPARSETILTHLFERGVDVQRHRRAGQLLVLSAAESYLLGGTFQPDALLTRARMQRILEQGYAGFRSCGDMSWTLHYPDAKRLVTHETRLHEFVQGNRCTTMCQYDRRRFARDTLLDVAALHPFIVCDGKSHINRLYTSAAQLLNTVYAGSHL